MSIPGAGVLEIRPGPGVGCDACKEVPHSVQKRVSSAFALAQEGQDFMGGAPV
jgi:hypothetical protein